MSDLLRPLPHAQVDSTGRFSLIWIIPLVALLIGSWLVYKVYSEKGDIVTLTFESAEGIEVKKTPIRYKDVTVGKVISVRLDSRLDKVLVQAEIVPTMAEHLGPDTRFWTVRPRITVKGISGLSTLLSGIYISMDPGEREGRARTVYKGLEAPPRVTSYTQGSTYTLQADKLGSLDVGSPVYYRQISVGEVVSYKLNDDKDTVGITVFIKEPYDKIVHKNSLFWNVSGLDIELSSGGVKARMESFTTLLLGGITFETPYSLARTAATSTDTIFPLYETREAAKEKNRGERLFYVMYFKDSLRGLKVGAPVEYRGIPVGKVEDIQLTVEEFNAEIKIPILISLYAEKLSLDGDIDDATEIVVHLVEKGVRGQLTTSNLLTGSQFISLVFPDDAASNPGEIKESSESGLAFEELPTTSGLTTLLAQSASDIMNEIHGGIVDARKLINSPEINSSTKDIAFILDNVSDLLKEIKPEIVASMEELSGTLKNTHNFTGKLHSTLTKLDGALVEAKKTLSSADSVLHEDSGLQYELRLLIEEVSEAASSFSVLANTLQHKPNSVIFGK